MSNIVEYGALSARELYSQIDSLAPEDREFGKLEILRSDGAYLDFLASVSGLAKSDVMAFLRDLDSDLVFKKTFLERARLLFQLSDVGDLRFHATTLYVLVRAQRPPVTVETGVAHGKSSAYILLALEHNGVGNLLSVDLPATGQLAPDGSRTHLSGLPAGWLVPDYLRRNWALYSEDSLSFLGKSLRNLLERQFRPHKVSLFLHDSLHTYDHVAAELALVKPLLNAHHCIAVDNIDMPGGAAFNDYLGNSGQVAHSFTDFGAVLHAGPSQIANRVRQK